MGIKKAKTKEYKTKITPKRTFVSKKTKILKKSGEPSKKNISRERYLVRRIIIMNVITISIFVVTYFLMILFLSNVGSFWDIFRTKEDFTNQQSIAPLPPYVTPLSPATQNSAIDITGETDPGGKVYLYVDSSKVDETIADSEGTFLFANVSVGVFSQKFSVKAVNSDGLESPSSTIYSVSQDNEPPKLEILTPNKVEEIRSTGHSYNVTGVVEPGSMVFVNEQRAIVNPTGEFSTSLRLEVGGNKIKIVAKDQADNETEEEVYINFSKID